MNDWDSRYPFSSEELDFFAHLHAKATKFPAPEFKNNSKPPINKIQQPEQQIAARPSHHSSPFAQYTTACESLKAELDSVSKLILNFDLLIESHRQLQFVEETPQANERRPTSALEKDEAALRNLRHQIAALESIDSARSLLKTCAIPSVASSPPFLCSLQLVFDAAGDGDEALIARGALLMQKCWDNALQAMHRVLERDLISLEAYLDDPVYSNLRNQVLLPLIRKSFNLIHLRNDQSISQLIVHFVNSYVTFRQHFLKTVFDVRLNSQISSPHPKDHILHLIERARLSMLVEQKEFYTLFPENNDKASLNADVKAALNKILETVGNLILVRLETSCSAIASNQNSSRQIVEFIDPLRRDLLIKNPKDPFGLFLTYIQSQIHVVINVPSPKESSPQSPSTINGIINV